MAAEDWEAFVQMKEERRLTKEERRDTFEKWFDENKPKGWVKHHPTHYSCQLLGDRLDYWPGPMRFRWRNRTMNGKVGEFIKARLSDERKR